MIKYETKLATYFGDIYLTVENEKELLDNQVIELAVKEINAQNSKLGLTVDEVHCYTVNKKEETNNKREELPTRTKSEIIKELMDDELDLNLHVKEEAKMAGMTLKQFRKEIAENTFNEMINEGSIVKVGNRYCDN